jgi:hypothetical protein
MARLSKDEWAEMRAEWELSPRQGLTWLVRSGGGRWDITEEPVRQRRSAENWTKRTNLADMARKAKEAADGLSVARLAEERAEAAAKPPEPAERGGGGAQPGGDELKKAGGLNLPARPPSGDPQADAEQAAIDVRTALVDRHRKEWDAVRQLFYRGMQQARTATGFESAKFAKISSEILHNIQLGERQAWGLDADLIDYDALTDDQLQRLANGKMPS